MPEEILDLIDGETGRVTGSAPRSRCHGNPALVHRAVHVVVFRPDGAILLQKRSVNKRIQPGKWDTAVGGHPASGEDYPTAALREMNEEIGLSVSPEALQVLFEYKVRNSIESENVRVYSLVSEGPFRIQEEELSEVRFYTRDELKRILDGGAEDFTPVLRRELRMIFGMPDDD